MAFAYNKCLNSNQCKTERLIKILKKAEKKKKNAEEKNHS